MRRATRRDRRDASCGIAPSGRPAIDPRVERRRCRSSPATRSRPIIARSRTTASTRRGARSSTMSVEVRVVRHEPAGPRREAELSGMLIVPGHVARSRSRVARRVSMTSAPSSSVRRQRARVEVRRLRKSAEHARAFLVHPLHLGEVLRRLGLAGEHARARTSSSDVGLERPVEALLVAERALRDRADALAARRSRRRGPARSAASPAASRTAAGSRYSVRALVSIVPATFAARSSRSGRPTSPTKMKSPVAAPIGSLAPARVGDEKRQVLRRVARRVDDVDDDVADRDAIAVLDAAARSDRPRRRTSSPRSPSSER